MLPMLALAVLLTAISTTAAQGGESAALGPRLATGAPEAGVAAIDLHVPSALAWIQPSLRGVVSSGSKRRATTAVAGARQPVAQARGGVLGGIGRLSSDRERAALAYPVSDSVSLDLGYRLLEVEDMVVRRVEPGTVAPTYSSHHLVLHARWRF